MHTEPTVVDLFSGAGGTGRGFLDAGFKIIGAVEKDRHAALTYSRNLKVATQIADLWDLNSEDFRVNLGIRRGELDVLAGCPPCQGFTRMRNSGGADDHRNGLVTRYIDHVREFQPKFAVFENVPGIVRTQHGREFYELLLHGLDELGYAVAEYLIDAADFGVPQHRRRVIVLAGRNRQQPPQLSPTHGDPSSPAARRGELQPWRTVRDALARYPALAPGEVSTSYPNHEAPRTGKRRDSGRIWEFIQQVPVDGGSRTDVDYEYWLPCHKRIDGFKDVYGRLAWDKPANTITGGCTNPSKGRFLHPEQHRALSCREAASLQGFLDSFVFYGSCVPQQIGNAVPPPLAASIGIAMRAAIG